MIRANELGDRDPNSEGLFLYACPSCGVAWWYAPYDAYGPLECCGHLPIKGDASEVYWRRMVAKGKKMALMDPDA